MSYTSKSQERHAIAKASYDFRLCDPKNWPGEKRWVALQVGKHEWKDVRAYDASDLEQCLEQSIPAQAWLAERLPLGSNDIFVPWIVAGTGGQDVAEYEAE